MQIARLLRVRRFRSSQAICDPLEMQAQLQCGKEEPEQKIECKTDDEGANQRIRPVTYQDLGNSRQFHLQSRGQPVWPTEVGMYELVLYQCRNSTTCKSKKFLKEVYENVLINHDSAAHSGRRAFEGTAGPFALVRVCDFIDLSRFEKHLTFSTSVFCATNKVTDSQDDNSALDGTARLQGRLGV
jgi:hypothetical protein